MNTVQFKKRTILRFLYAIIFFISVITVISAQTVEEYDKRGDKYFNEKQYSLAVTEWIKALEIDPDNIEIQQKIESVFEEKKKKDLAVQLVKKNLREIKKDIDDGNPEKGKEKSDAAVRNFIIAYRIDPNDPELQLLKKRVTKTRNEINVAIQKQRLSRENKRKYAEYHSKALEARDKKDFQNAIVWYDRMLEIFPDDTVARQGKYEANLAMQSRLKYEKIKQYLDNGIELYNKGEYTAALNEFREVIRIDPGNPDADSYITRIDEKLEEQYELERKLSQAEQFYQSGDRNAKANRFDDAREDYKTVLSLIPDFRDTKIRLAALDQQQKDFEERMKKETLEKINQEFQKGLSYLAQSEFREAISSFELVLQYDPNNQLAKRYIATAKEALNLERQDIIDSESPYYSVVKSLEKSGELYYDSGQYSRSLEQWERILKLFPNNAVATEYLLKCQLKLNPDLFHRYAREQIEQGKNLLEKKQYNSALRKFEIVQSISPDYPGINELIASTQRTKPEIPDVISAAVSTTPGSPPAPTAAPAEIQRRYDSGMYYFRQGGKDNILKALSEFRWVARNDPRNVKAIININNIESQLRLGSASNKKETGNRLSEDQKALVRKYYLNGINYYTANRFPEAISEWRKVLSIDPGHEKAKNNIRKCLLLMEQ